VKGDLNPRQFDVEKAKAFSEKHNLRYYTEEMHQAAFALPRFVKELLEGK
jgi:spermidine synthase